MPLWRVVIKTVAAGGLALGLLLGTLSAQAAESALTLAQKALKAGKTDIAIKALNEALGANGLKGADVARAYYWRGLANAKAGHAATAIADLSHALWLKGLTDSERKQAEAAKAAAFGKAGVADKTGESVPPPEGDVQISEATAPEPTPKAKPIAAVLAKAAPNKRAAKGPKKRQATPVDVTPAAAPAEAETLPWAAGQPESPQVMAAAKPAESSAASGDNPVTTALGSLFALGQPAAAATPPEDTAVAKVVTPAPQPAAAKAEPQQTGIFLQLASLRSQADAQLKAGQIAADHAATLGEIGASVTPTVIGNMGTFYAVRVGPVASKAAGQSLCTKLRQEGVDCFFATP